MNFNEFVKVKPYLRELVKNQGDDLLESLGEAALDAGWEAFKRFWNSEKRIARVERRRTLRGKFGLRWRKISRKLNVHDLDLWLDRDLEPQ